MATHSSTLAWKIPWKAEPGRLHFMGSLRVGHDWVTSLLLFTFMHWRRKWQPTPILLPGKSHGLRSLVGYSLWGREESDTTEWLHFTSLHLFNDFNCKSEISSPCLYTSGKIPAQVLVCSLFLIITLGTWVIEEYLYEEQRKIPSTYQMSKSAEVTLALTLKTSSWPLIPKGKF